jgi:hypothetical protein
MFNMSLHAGQNGQMQSARSFDEPRRTLVYAGADSDERNAAGERFSTSVQRARDRRRPVSPLRKDGWYRPMSAGTSCPLHS